ncbi:MAG: SDR family oxidoreductase [Chlorobiaceae bacterium]|nr:SDR family oxidoreductase [Chlorobiaceae bacterium]
MSYWRGKCAIVTGAASGIGFALSTALVELGAKLWIADIDPSALEKAAFRLGPSVRPVVLDVRDSSAFKSIVERAVGEDGAIDFLFNNAGILISGETCDFDTERFDRIIDVNIRGVVNGTMAAYPVMIAQGHGHIVNTASLGGLMPSPLLAAYGMSKHAVVGLTKSMRFEGEKYGVRFSAICPGGVDTPMLDESGEPKDSRVSSRPDVRRYLTRLAGKPCKPEVVATEALKGVEKNRDIIVIPGRARLTTHVYRFAPWLVHSIGRMVLASER